MEKFHIQIGNTGLNKRTCSNSSVLIERYIMNLTAAIQKERKERGEGRRGEKRRGEGKGREGRGGKGGGEKGRKESPT